MSEELDGTLIDSMIGAMFGSDRAVADKAKRMWDEIHANDPKPTEPRHCENCFDGCSLCEHHNPFEGESLDDLRKKVLAFLTDGPT